MSTEKALFKLKFPDTSAENETPPAVGSFGVLTLTLYSMINPLFLQQLSPLHVQPC